MLAFAARVPPRRALSIASHVVAVRAADPEAFLCCSLLPAAARDSAFAMRALDLELAAVQSAARGNAGAGRVRMAFWRDLVDAAFAGRAQSAGASPPRRGVEAHPLFAPLASAVAAHAHTRRWLERMIDARDADLDAPPPDTMAALERHAEATQSSLLYLALEACGIRSGGTAGPGEAAAAAAEAAASHIGMAIGLITTVRALPVHARSRRCFVPADIISKHGLVADDFFVGHGDMLHRPSGRPLHEWVAQRQGGGGATAAAAAAAPPSAGDAAVKPAPLGPSARVQSADGAAAATAIAAAASARATSRAPAPQRAAPPPPRGGLGGMQFELDASPPSLTAMSESSSSSGGGGVRFRSPLLHAPPAAGASPASPLPAASGSASAASSGAAAAGVEASGSQARALAASIAASARKLPLATAPLAAAPAASMAAARAIAAAPPSGIGGGDGAARASSASSLHIPLADIGILRPPRVSAALVAAAEELLEAAAAHVAAARALRGAGALPRAALPALLPAVPAMRALGQLREAGGDAFARGLVFWSDAEHGAPLARLRLQLALARHAMLDSF